MTRYLQYSAPAGLALAGLFVATVMLAATPASASGDRFCIAQSSNAGSSSYVGNCIFSDYQQCLEAAVGSRGTCVANIAYSGGTASQTATFPPRRGR